MRLELPSTVIASLALSACAFYTTPPIPPASPSAVGQPLARSAAIADIDSLLAKIENIHPDLYAKRSRDSTARDRARLIAGLPASMSRGDLWIALASFMAGFGDGHTNINIPIEEVVAAQQAGMLVFPPSVALDEDNRLIITTAFGATGLLARGDRVSSLNGLNTDSLVHAWSREFSGEDERFRLSNVTSNFRTLAFVHGLRAPYTLAIDSRTVTLTGITQDSLLRLARQNQVRNAVSANFTYRTLEPHVGYMNLRSLAGDRAKFAADVSQMFGQVAADSDRALIIDLRENGGGDTRLGDELLAHFNAKPYRLSSGKDWKMSAEYRDMFKAGLTAPMRWIQAWHFFPIGRELMHGPDGKIVHMAEEPGLREPKQPFFSGKVCVLIGSRTFSSAADLADGIKTYGLATLIGEETGGRANSFGEVYFFRLPQSQLIVAVSSARFVRANGDPTNMAGVLPDIAVTPSREDVRAGRDAVLERARRDCP